MEVNIQCQQILEGIERLETYIQEKIAKEALDLDSNFETTRNQELLLRLKKSLLQYTERGKSLTYIGFMGHFSAGKSSTINSLLGMDEDSEEARKVGLNPVDKTITLITHSENKDSIFNTTKEGLVSIRASFINSEFLKNVVIADTPGTGDPILASEIAQDFLPICDLLIYLFSAAIPLDSADVPLLREKHSNLAFIPIQFVVTRADEFKKDHESSFSNENFDNFRASSFLNELSQRINQLFSDSHYIDSYNITLINNKPRFHIEQLAKIIRDCANLSDINSQINIHSHKIIYFQSSAEKLKLFFCNFLLDKLDILSEIIRGSQDNIERFKGRIRLTNNELTESWNRKILLIRNKNYEAFERLETSPEIPTSINLLCSKVSRNSLLEYYWKDEVTQRVQLIKEDIKRNLLPSIKAHTDAGKHKVNSFTSLSRLENSENLRLNFDDFQKDKLFINVDLLPSAMLSSQALRISGEADSQISEYHRELRNAVESLKKLLTEQQPVKEYQSILNSAISDLLRDFDACFDSITVYRSGVFALNVKEAISKLGLGHQMDVLESSELTEAQKEIIKQDAQEHIFPGAYQAFTDSKTRLSDLQVNVEELQKRVHAMSARNSATPNNSLEDWKNSQLDIIKEELSQDIESALGRLQQNVNIRINELITKFNHEWESEVTRMKAERKKRLVTSTLSFGIGGLALYLIYIFGSQKDLTNNIFIAFVFGIIVNIISDTVGFVWAKTTDKFPINIKAKESSILSQFREEYAQAVDGVSESFDDLVNPDNQFLYEFWKSLLVTETLKSWAVRNESFYMEIRALVEEYSLLRSQYLEITSAATELASNYFKDTDKNLTKLNEFLDNLQETAIKPSFELLAETKENLDVVIQNIQEIDFT